MRANDYIEAVFKLLSEGQAIDLVIPKLQSALRRKGSEKLYPLILKGLLKRFEKEANSNTTIITVARQKDVAQLATDIKSALDTLNANGSFQTSVDETIIGGFKITQGGTVVDRTYKKQLVALYRSLID